MIEEIKNNKSFYIFESIVLIILGFLAIILPGIFSYSMELLLGVILVLSGLVQGYRAFKFKSSKEALATLFLAIFTLLVGLSMLFFPIQGIIALTLLIAIFFLIEGLAQLYMGYQIRHQEGWGWIVFSGLTSIFLSFLIFSELPGSARWVIGLLVGINLLIIGFSQLILVNSIANTNKY